MFNNLIKTLLGGSSVASLSPRQYQTDFAQGKRPHMLIDVRTAEEFKSGHIPGAVNIALQSIDRQLQAIPCDRPVILYCRTGNRSGQAGAMLKQAGYADVFNLGGIGDWQADGLPVK